MKFAVTMASRLVQFSPRLARLAAGMLGSPLRYLKGDLAEKKQISINLPDTKLALVNDLDLVSIVLADKQGIFPKSADLELILRPLIGRGVFGQPGGELVKKARKTYVAALSQLPDSAISLVSRSVTKRYLHTWGLHAGTVPIPSELSRLTIDVVSEATLGTCFTEQESRRFVELFFRYHKRVNPLLLLLTSRNPDDREALFARFGLEKIGDEMRDLIRHRFLVPLLHEDPGACTSPFGSVLLKATQESIGNGKSLIDDKMRQTAIIDEIAVMLLAGHETSASVLSWLLWELANQPAEQLAIRRLLNAQEAHAASAATPGQSATASEADRRLAALINESLRLYPPIALLLRESTQETALGSRRLPADSYVVVSPWSIHRHGGRWEHAQAFQPSRWLTEDSPPALRERMAFIPFGYGPRVCPGKRFAEVEMQAILSELIRSSSFSRTWGKTPKPLGMLTSRPDRDFRLTAAQLPA
jgi:cytochrome P450